MCGIAGAFCFSGNALFSNIMDRLDKAANLMKSRGPDGTGFLVDQDHRLGFVHNRLKIQDLSDKANQPFFSSDKKAVVVFNGQLYNHWELRDEMIKDFGYKFFTTSDTETLVAAYQCFGLEKSLQKFRGMFAFALYDFEMRKIFLVRDRFGIKPLYFQITAEGLLFASQLNAILSLSEVDPEVSKFSLYHYLHLLAVPAPLTIYKNIFKLPAGFYLEIDEAGTQKTVRWYNLLDEVSSVIIPQRLDAVQEQLEALLQDSVKRHVLSSDVKVAVFLSGGVDSSLLTMLASKYRSVTAFHVRFGGRNFFPESLAASRIAKKCGVDYEELHVDEIFFARARELFLSNVDDLVADPVCISFYALCEYVSSQGFKVALLGEGADELCFGYDLYQKHARLDYFGKVLAWFPSLLRRIAEQIFSGYKQESLLRLASGKSSFEFGALGFFSSQLQDLKKDVLENKIALNEQLEIVTQFWSCKSNLDPFDASTWFMEPSRCGYENEFWFGYKEFFHRLPELLLMRCDKVGMLSGLETRVPFLDHKVVEFLFRVPQRFKVFNGQPKALLKNITEKYQGSKMVWQKKRGFSAPFLIEDSTVIKPAIKISSNRRLSVLQQWCLNLFLKKCVPPVFQSY